VFTSIINQLHIGADVLASEKKLFTKIVL